MPSYTRRAEAPDPGIESLARRAVRLISAEDTVFLDAGTTLNAVASNLPDHFNGLVVSPAPSVALAALHLGKTVHLVGGSLCPDGAMATGGSAENAVQNFAADICLLGACGLWPEFGLSAENESESRVKNAMACAAAKTVVVASATKLDRLGRHRVLNLEEIDVVVTNASKQKAQPLVEAGIEVLYA